MLAQDVEIIVKDKTNRREHFGHLKVIVCLKHYVLPKATKKSEL